MHIKKIKTFLLLLKQRKYKLIITKIKNTLSGKTQKQQIIPYWCNNYTFIPRIIETKEIAIYLHIKDIENLDYYISKLNTITECFSLYISLDKHVDLEKVEAICKCKINNNKKIYQINKKDINKLIQKYDYLFMCTINANQYRNKNIFDSLFASESRVNQIINLLSEKADVFLFDNKITARKITKNILKKYDAVWIKLDSLKQKKIKSVYYYSQAYPSAEYEDKYDFTCKSRKNKDIKILSYYLPQFDTNPINDKYHGKGFTEWTNVASAEPLFNGHYQQHVPHKEIGYYHLNSVDVLKKQAEFMKKVGLFGQIFYHYWFSGKMILEKPAQMLLDNKDIDMPFCFCWANENWTKKWDGNVRETILEQVYSKEDAASFIQYLIPFFKDKRYITVDDHPVLFIYRVESIPNFIDDYLTVWIEECEKAGIKKPYLVATLIRGVTSPKPYKMDAAVERCPYDWGEVINTEITNQMDYYESPASRVFDYKRIVEHCLNLKYSGEFPVYKSAFTNWDNTARYKEKAFIVHESSPRDFQKWVKQLISYSHTNLPENQRFIVINAWNEWAEGAHLEPDEKYGFAYLNSIGRELYE